MPIEKGFPHINSKEQLLEELMCSLGDQVLYTALSYVKNYQVAEDIAQEVFVKVYQKLDEFRGESSIKTWVIRITINHSKDYLRSWYYRKTLLSNKIGLFAKGTEETPEFEYILKEESDALTKGLFSLPLKFREVLFLYFYEELTLKEISEVLNQNISTTKSRFYKAKDLLNKIYEEREKLVWK
ncbi:sigma-70 family RNA polymerase sigma factor [Rossellomorea marisflavi]|uniref:sigma-70 family RNA polymerase sigma factor n=1 Tax=Rossellomorea marisflavi TaxID=189381 RepID=UPI0011E65CCE|nr:sigma-70 family RNA polymerase sigma factor [Rossellomorea marisflavi]TYO68601.1 sigma-70 family RNA polymerase sigma factor [Rossellomorea marisflavi]